MMSSTGIKIKRPINITPSTPLFHFDLLLKMQYIFKELK